MFAVRVWSQPYTLAGKIRRDPIVLADGFEFVEDGDTFIDSPAFSEITDKPRNKAEVFFY